MAQKHAFDIAHTHTIDQVPYDRGSPVGALVVFAGLIFWLGRRFATLEMVKEEIGSRATMPLAASPMCEQ
jgi:hypothetical protein